MFDFSPHSFHTPGHRILWYGLAFQAGAINAGGFLATHSFVSHVTGIGTMIGIELAGQHLLTAFELLTVPLSFLTGAICSALLIERPRAVGKPPYYPLAMGIMAILLNFVLIFGVMGWFGKFGEEFIYYRDIVLVSILAFTCGMQNSAIVSATRGSIRTTHLTGIITDIGINLVRIGSFPSTSEDRARESIINLTRMVTFIFFSVGSAVSAVLFSKYEFVGFSVPAMTSFIFFIVSLSSAYSKTLNRELMKRPRLRSSQPTFPD